MIDQSTVDRIFSTAQIHEVVGDFVSLKKRGVNYIGNCPFHNEKTPSFTVSPAKGICKCFGCGKGGNSVNFIMEIEQLSYYEALKYLAKKYNIEIVEKEATPEEKKKQTDRESMMVVSNFAQEYFTKTLKTSSEGQAVAMAYFRERGFRDDIIEKFDLGYCRDVKDGLTTAALEKGYKLQYLEKTGLTIVRDNYRADRFKGRVIFPIHSVSGKVIGFGGRVLKEEKKTAKYLNSPESEIYNKSRVLYGIAHAKRSILQEDKCYLVEGYTDVLSFHQSGIENVVASSGTSLTVDQIKLIKRFTPNVTIIYDGDQAGIKASFRGINMVLAEDLNVKVLPLPDGEDPDSFAKGKSATELKEHIAAHEMDFIRFKTEILLEQAGDDPVRRAGLINDIVETLSVIPNNVVQAVYIKECSNLLDIREEVLYEALGKKTRNKQFGANAPIARKPQPKGTAQVSKQPKTDSVAAHERDIVRLLLLYGKHELDRVQTDAGEDIITVGTFIYAEIIGGEMNVVNPLYAKFIDSYFKLGSELSQEQVEQHYVNSQDAELSDLAVTLLSEVENQTLHRIWVKGGPATQESDILYEMVPHIITSYKERRINAEIISISALLKENPPAEQLMELMQRLQQLTEYKTMLAKSLKNRGVM